MAPAREDVRVHLKRESCAVVAEHGLDGFRWELRHLDDERGVRVAEIVDAWEARAVEKGVPVPAPESRGPQRASHARYGHEARALPERSTVVRLSLRSGRSGSVRVSWSWS